MLHLSQRFDHRQRRQQERWSLELSIPIITSLTKTAVVEKEEEEEEEEED